MSVKSTSSQLVFDIIQDGIQRGLLNLAHTGKSIKNNMLCVGDAQLLSFSSCSYLGLEYDERLRQAAKDAIDAYGTQFSSSRTYVSLGLYETYEALLSRIFGYKTIVASTTTLGHISCLPVVVEAGDAVILDHQVHHSVQTAAGLLRSKRVHIEMVRHNNMEMLEQRIKHLRTRFNRIWYLADGVYSMYGDLCPLAEVESLLNRYEQFHFYVDDAHGMSYMGPNGSGYVCSRMPQLHPRMILATSLNKAFAAGGGALVIPDEQLYERVRTCGSTFITSGPLQPANLGAGIASAQLHLSPELPAMQQELQDKIQFCRLLTNKHQLPLIGPDPTAIFFIGLGMPALGYKLVQKMMQQGYLLNLGIFPAVPVKNTGVRFTITRGHSYDQISDMISCLKECFDQTLQEEGVTLAEIYKAFRMEPPERARQQAFAGSVIRQSLQLQARHYSSILDIDRDLWNRMFEGRGAFDWQALAGLEHSFQDNEKPEDNWAFDYLIISDHNSKPIAASCATTALWKDDLQSPEDISRKIESLREHDPYYLVSKVTATGTLITEGEHVYVDKASELWPDALKMLLHELSGCAERRGADTLFVRDMLDVAQETASLISENGFFKVAMPDTHIVDLEGWHTMEDFYRLLSPKNKDNFRKDVKRHFGMYSFEPVPEPTEAQIRNWYELYLAVKNRNLELNTFALPLRFFREAVKTAGWEACELRRNGRLLTVTLSYRSGDTYIPTVIGIDYSQLKEHSAYKRSLFQLMLRARSLGCSRVHLGFGAGSQKRRLLARAIPASAFVQARDNFNAEFLEHLQLVSDTSKSDSDNP